MSKRFLDLDRKYSNSGEVESTYLLLDTSLIRDGLLKSLTPTQLKVLLAIASHMDDGGEAFPSIRHISEITGIATPTVNKAIKQLLDVKCAGNLIMTRNVEGSGARKKSRYSFVIDTDIVNDPTVSLSEEQEELELNARTAIILFCEEFKKEFGFEYKVIWQKEIRQMRKLLDLYEDEKVRTIIDITIHEYSKRWHSVKFPVPSIGAMCSWIYKEALKIHIDREQKSPSKWEQIDNNEEDLNW